MGRRRGEAGRVLVDGHLEAVLRRLVRRQERQGVLYTIRVPKGSEVATVRSKGEHDSEDEAIAQAGSRYRILSMGPKGPGQLQVEVELVQDQLEEK